MYGASWVLDGPDVAWVFTLEIRQGSRFSLICGVDIYALREDQRPKNANQCLIVFDAEGLPAAVDGYQVRQAFSLDYEMDGQAREVEVRQLLGAIVAYARERLTLENIRASFLAGELADGFVHYRARQVLDTRTA